MQRVSAFLPSWEKRQSTTSRNSVNDNDNDNDSNNTNVTANANVNVNISADALNDNINGNNSKVVINTGSNGLFGWSHRSSASFRKRNTINTLAPSLDVHKVQRERFWPSTLDIECDKAARILKSFCVDGFLASLEDDDSRPPSSTVALDTLNRRCERIPKRVIQNAAGIAVFSCMRSGLWMTGSGGSGILIARKSDGTWSPPSGIMLHTPTLSFIIGVDIYDCVLVVSSFAALEAVTAGRVNLGNEVELRSGQTVAMDSDEADVNWKDLGDSVQTYMKARGRQQSVDMNGCILTERSNENERFYYADVTQMEILSGSVAKEVEETTPLFEVIKMAEGRTDFDQSVVDKVAAEAAPSDAIISTPISPPASPQRPFGIVGHDDPDPFGVLALEMAGLEIREAGSRIRPTSSMIDIKLTPLSPIFSSFGRQSMDASLARSDRGSVMSARTMRSQLTDTADQNDAPVMPETPLSPGHSDSGNGRVSPVGIPEDIEEEEEEEEEKEVEKTDEVEEVAKAVEEEEQPAVEHLAGHVEEHAEKRDEEKAAENEEEEEHQQEKNDEEEHGDEEVKEEDEDGDEEEEDIDVEEFDCMTAQATPVCVNRASITTISSTHSAPALEDANEKHLRESTEDHHERQLVDEHATDDEDDINDADDEDEDEIEERDDEDEEGEAEEEEEEEEDEEPAVFEIVAVQPARTQAVASRMIQARGNVVTIAKRVPPPLPKRSPARLSRISKPEIAPRNPLRLSTSGIDVADQQKAADSPVDDQQHGEPREEAKAEEAGEEVETEAEADLKAEAEVGVKESHSGVPDLKSTPVDNDTTEEPRVEFGDEESEDNEEAALELDPRDELVLSESHLDAADISDSASNKKHTSSIYTGITEDRWSFDGSSVTTPISERRFSMIGDKPAEDTPKRLTADMGQPVVRESLSSLHGMIAHDPITATD